METLTLSLHPGTQAALTPRRCAALQVDWLRGFAGPPEGRAWQALRYVGLLAPGAASVERALRMKCLLLTAACLKRRSLWCAPAQMVRGVAGAAGARGGTMPRVGQDRHSVTRMRRALCMACSACDRLPPAACAVELPAHLHDVRLPAARQSGRPYPYSIFPTLNLRPCQSSPARNGRDVSRRWLRHLPAPVRAAGAPAAQCCLFWPPPGAEVPGEGEPLGGLWARLRRSPLARSLRLAAKARPAGAAPQPDLSFFRSVELAHSDRLRTPAPARAAPCRPCGPESAPPHAGPRREGARGRAARAACRGLARRPRARVSGAGGPASAAAGAGRARQRGAQARRERRGACGRLQPRLRPGWACARRRRTRRGWGGGWQRGAGRLDRGRGRAAARARRAAGQGGARGAAAALRGPRARGLGRALLAGARRHPMRAHPQRLPSRRRARLAHSTAHSTALSCAVAGAALEGAHAGFKP